VSASLCAMDSVERKNEKAFEVLDDHVKPWVRRVSPWTKLTALLSMALTCLFFLRNSTHFEFLCFGHHPLDANFSWVAQYAQTRNVDARTIEEIFL
jgi:hypothetical protein